MSDDGILRVGTTVQVFCGSVRHEVTGLVENPDTEPLTITEVAVTIDGAAGPAASASVRDGADVWVTFVPTAAGLHRIAFKVNAAGGVRSVVEYATVEAWP